MSTIGNEKVRQYINQVCDEVKNKRVHGNISEELQCHIEDIVEEYLDYGICEEDAIEKALLQMGPSFEIGKNLDKVHKAASDWPLILMTVSLVLFGIFTLWTIGKDNIGYGIDYSSYALKSAIYTIMGLIISLVIFRVDYRSLKKSSKYIYLVTIIVCIIASNITPVVNGASGWIVIGSMSFNIFVLAPFFFVISLAGIFHKWDWSTMKGTLIGVVFAGVPCIFLLMGNSGASVIIYTIAVISLVIISGIKLRYLLISIIAGGGAFILALISHPYRITRIFAFLNPGKDPYGAGWMYNQLNNIRHSSGLLGKEEFFSVATLPEIHTDFIFTYIMYTFGFIACILLITLILGFIIRIGIIGAKTKDSYGKLLVSGLCAMFASQFVLNILMNFTLSPILAVGMPFISYSGSSVIINIISISIIISVYKWRNTPYTIGKLN